MKRLALFLCLILVFLILSACSDAESIMSLISSAAGDISNVPVNETSVDIAPEPVIEEVIEPEEEISETVIPVADYDVIVTPDEEVFEEIEPETDEISEEILPEVTDSEGSVIIVTKPLDISISFNHELIKDEEGRDILDLRTSVPYISPDCCEGAEVIDAIFYSEAEAFCERIKSSLSETGNENEEDPVLRSAEMICTVAYNKNGLLSVILDSYSYLDEDEPTVSRNCHVFDINTGAHLGLWDILDSSVMNSEELCSLMGADSLNQSLDENMFYLTDTGIAFFHLIGNDIQEFIIPYESCSLLINPTIEGGITDEE